MFDTNYIVNDMISKYFGESSNDNIKCVSDDIEDCVKMLENKDYRVKYASPGHDNTKFSNDANKDGVINNKLVSTARVIFNKDYGFDTTPKGWEWKILSNGSKALYVRPFTYNKKYGSQSEAFNKWKIFYIGSLRDWIKNLPMMGNDSRHIDADTDFNAS